MPDQNTPLNQRTPLTREAIIEAAIALADREGIGAVSLRKIGALLGVHATSIYNHVPSKEALLDQVAAHLLGGLAAPEIRAQSWPEMSRSVARAYRQLGLTHPALFPQMITRPFGAEASVAALEGLLAVYREAGFGARATFLGFMLITSFVEGFTTGEIARSVEPPGEAGSWTPLGEVHDPARYPVVQEVFSTGAVSSEEAFEAGLNLVIEAIDALLRAE